LEIGMKLWWLTATIISFYGYYLFHKVENYQELSETGIRHKEGKVGRVLFFFLCH
jgi:hypothetical protein